MKKLNYILTGALLVMSSALFAQQESSFTMGRYQMNMINPAYAGMNNETIATSLFRSQWMGIPEAPTTQAVSFGTPMGKNVGLGLSMVNDRTFVEKQTFVAVDFSYKVKMNDVSDLYLGLKAGGNFYSVNATGLETYNVQSDPSLAAISTFTPNLGVGAVWKNENYFVSLSVPKMLSTQRAKNNAGYATVATDRPHIYLSGGYDFELNTATPLVFKPSILMRYVHNAPVSIDFNALLQIDKLVEVGAMYRTDQAFAGVLDILVSKRLLVGYAYEVSTRPVLASAKNTSELLLRFKF